MILLLFFINVLQCKTCIGNITSLFDHLLQFIQLTIDLITLIVGFIPYRERCNLSLYFDPTARGFFLNITRFHFHP
ncbi:hypothetical protein HanRHA438_Chr06g0262271 [Helianthus annuus]|nr:hypothetical protein HanRHA438_Chr06g0262271 [Helianthus annuus]